MDSLRILFRMHYADALSLWLEKAWSVAEWCSTDYFIKWIRFRVQIVELCDARKQLLSATHNHCDQEIHGAKNLSDRLVPQRKLTVPQYTRKPISGMTGTFPWPNFSPTSGATGMQTNGLFSLPLQTRPLDAFKEKVKLETNLTTPSESKVNPH